MAFLILDEAQDIFISEHEIKFTVSAKCKISWDKYKKDIYYYHEGCVVLQNLPISPIELIAFVWVKMRKQYDTSE